MRFSVSRTDNLVNVFDSVTSPPVLSYHCVLSYFLTMSVGFPFNLTFGLKPEVTVYKRSIFQVEWLIATLIKTTSTQFITVLLPDQNLIDPEKT